MKTNIKNLQKKLAALLIAVVAASCFNSVRADSITGSAALGASIGGALGDTGGAVSGAIAGMCFGAMCEMGKQKATQSVWTRLNALESKLEARSQTLLQALENRLTVLENRLNARDAQLGTLKHETDLLERAIFDIKYRNGDYNNSMDREDWHDYLSGLEDKMLQEDWDE